jgi:predicted transcriptional regulator
VIQHNDIIGLISLKDIQKKSSDDLAEARVWDLMKRFPYQLSVTPGDHLILALKIMISQDVNFLPVKDTRGQLKGLITLESIADYLDEKKII